MRETINNVNNVDKVVEANAQNKFHQIQAFDDLISANRSTA